MIGSGYCPGGGAATDRDAGRARKVRCPVCGRRLTAKTMLDPSGSKVAGHQVPAHKARVRRPKAPRRKERRGRVR